MGAASGGWVPWSLPRLPGWAQSCWGRGLGDQGGEHLEGLPLAALAPLALGVPPLHHLQVPWTAWTWAALLSDLLAWLWSELQGLASQWQLCAPCVGSQTARALKVARGIDLEPQRFRLELWTGWAPRRAPLGSGGVKDRLEAPMGPVVLVTHWQRPA